MKELSSLVLLYESEPCKYVPSSEKPSGRRQVLILILFYGTFYLLCLSAFITRVYINI